MEVTGKFKIKDSFKVTGKGLVVIGDIIEGKVTIGSVITFNTGFGNVTLTIGGIKMGYNSAIGGYFVALLFDYKDESERERYGSLKLKEQIITIH